MRRLVSTHMAVFFVVLGTALPSWSQQPAETVIRGGTIVTSEGRYAADVRTRGGLIVDIGENLEAGAGARELDATGLLVIPGGIDPHVHVRDNSVDTYESGSRSALAGGLTTISSFPFQQAPVLTGGFPPVRKTLARAIEGEVPSIRRDAIADFMLHPVIDDPDAQQHELATLSADTGQTSIKVFMASPDFDDNVRGYLAVLDAAREAGILTMFHCEDGPIVERAVEELAAAGRTAFRHYPDSRPALAEVVATQRAVAMVEATGAPIYIVHLSAERALRVAQQAQARGLPVWVETRAIYLHFTRESLDRPDRERFRTQPPLRTTRDQDAFWTGIANGSIHVVATDHGGIDNLQMMRPMLFSDGVVTGRISAERFVAVTATNPARLFGLYPRKGTIAVGSDADIVLWDPDEVRTVRDEDMFSNRGYSIYAGREVTGWPVVTIRRGEIVYQNGEVRAAAGSGQLLRRSRWQAP